MRVRAPFMLMTHQWLKVCIGWSLNIYVACAHTAVVIAMMLDSFNDLGNGDILPSAFFECFDY